MHIYFLDDDRTRTRRFISKVPCAVCVEKASEMIQLLNRQTEPIQSLFLDHDLGGEIFVSSAREDCGMEVVRWLCKNAQKKSKQIEQIIIHSHNHPAAEEMFNALQQHGFKVARIPFSQMIERIDYIP